MYKLLFILSFIFVYSVCVTSAMPCDSCFWTKTSDTLCSAFLQTTLLYHKQTTSFFETHLKKAVFSYQPVFSFSSQPQRNSSLNTINVSKDVFHNEMTKILAMYQQLELFYLRSSQVRLRSGITFCAPHFYYNWKQDKEPHFMLYQNIRVTW